MSEQSENEDLSSVATTTQHTSGPHSTEKATASSNATHFARSEDQAVSLFRYLFLFLLLSTTVIVAWLVYHFVRHDQIHDFEAAYDANAERIISSFHDALARTVGAVDAMSVFATSHTLSTGATFPNVMIPGFEVSGAVIRILMGSTFLVWSPFVTDDKRDSYEAFMKSQYQQSNPILSEQFDEELRNRQDDYFGLPHVPKFPYSGDHAEHPWYQGYHDQIYVPGKNNEAKVAPNGTDYIIFLEQSPSTGLLGKVNAVLGGLRVVAAKEVKRTGRATLSSVNFFTPQQIISEELNRIFSVGQFRHQQHSYENDPVSAFAYPVFDNFSQDRNIEGILFGNFVWKLFFQNILPPNVQGVVCVIENSEGQVFTYRLDGPDAIYLGEGDHHDPHYDSMATRTDIIKFVRDNAGPSNQGFTSAGINDDFIIYELVIYPSQDMEDQYVSNAPVWFALGAVLIFSFTSGAFLLYDFLVEKRQAIVMNQAVRSTAVVASLFPEQVHDRLFNQQEVEEKATNVKGSSSAKAKDLLQEEEDADTAGSVLALKKPGGKVGKPIADKFPNSTVMFADLAGFTNWSSDREPEDVFVLLETIYGAFDEIAVRRSVFKVETIGDCYMCVTGVPNAQVDHAIRMVKFARECLAKMERLSVQLSAELGRETETLGFRVGLNSGPVTAGVLRGQKSRFQLFGDTVNTAARMETTGQKGRIHLSQSTADELINSGKASWVEARGGLVNVKGKGEMQTYFLTMMTGSRSVAGYTVAGSRESGESDEADGPDESGSTVAETKENESEDDLDTTGSPSRLVRTIDEISTIVTVSQSQQQVQQHVQHP